MICFPLDNTEYEANALGAWCATRTRGVFAAEGHYAVIANGDMTVTVGPGLAWLKADTHWGVNAFEINAQVLTLDTADGALSRVDAVCVRLDKNRNFAEIVIKKGSYALQSPPIAPPERSLDYDEIYVATVLVRAGATFFTASDITDQRLNEDYCGIMRDGVTGIPTQMLYDQWAGWMADFTAEAQAYYGSYQTMVADRFAQYTASIAAHESDAQQAYNAYVAFITNFETTAQTDFNTWFASIRDILDENTAGTLLNMIQATDARVTQLEGAMGGIETNVAGQLTAQNDQMQQQFAAQNTTVADQLQAQNAAVDGKLAAVDGAIAQKLDIPLGDIFALTVAGWVAVAGVFEQIVSVPGLPANTPEDRDWETTIGAGDWDSADVWGKFGLGFYAQPAGQLVFRARKQPTAVFNGTWSYARRRQIDV